LQLIIEEAQPGSIEKPFRLAPHTDVRGYGNIADSDAIKVI